jgi:hypothetical protein
VAVEAGEAVQDTATKVSETSKAPERQTMARDERRIGWLVWAGAAAILAIISILLLSG